MRTVTNVEMSKDKQNKKDSHSESPGSDMLPPKRLAKTLSWTGSCQAGILIMLTKADPCIDQDLLTAAMLKRPEKAS